MSITRRTPLAKKYKYCILICCFLSVLICVGHIFVNTAILLAGFAVFLLFVFYSALNRIAVPVLLFFLPWSPIFKLAPGQMSFYTIALFLACFVAFANNYHRMSMNYFVFPLLVTIATGTSKLISGYYIDNSYVLFIVVLFLFPAMIYETDGNYDFYMITIFFAFGIATSALLSIQLNVYSSVSRFVYVLDLHQFGIIRYSGFYGDSNFYSAHIAPAIGGLLIMLMRPIKKKRFVITILALLVLFYCGFLGASKSFIIIITIVFILWFLSFLFIKNKLSVKLLVIFVVIFALIFIFTSSLFSDSLDVIITRFGQGLDTDTLTTGRADLWSNYMNLFSDDIKVLFLGQGFTNINLAGRASHNTLLQLIYQFGIIGSVFMIGWIVTLFRKILDGVKLKAKNIPLVAVFTISSFGLWMGIDVIFGDDFFLILFYYVFGLRMILRSDLSQTPEELPDINDSGGNNEIRRHT